MATMESSQLISDVVRGHHVNKYAWNPFTGERLQLCQQDDNDYDYHAMSDNSRPQ